MLERSSVRAYEVLGSRSLRKAVSVRIRTMSRRASAVLLLALANIACRKDPVLGADVDLPAVAAATPSEPSPPTSNAAVISSPPLTRQVLAGFPACVVDPPPRPLQRIPCNGVGDGACWRNKERRRTVGDEAYVVTEIRPLLVACLRPSLLPSSLAWATIGILPSGRICAPSFASSVTLLTHSLACAARRLHAYRATVADTSSGLTLAVVPQQGAPTVPRSTP